MLFGAASDLKPGKSIVIKNDLGDSYTVSKSKDGKTINIKGNNKQSRDKLNNLPE